MVASGVFEMLERQVRGVIPHLYTNLMKPCRTANNSHRRRTYMILQSLLLGLWADPVHTEWWRVSVVSRAGEEQRKREREREMERGREGEREGERES